jgi:hypothetical protein
MLMVNDTRAKAIEKYLQPPEDTCWVSLTDPVVD